MNACGRLSITEEKENRGGCVTMGFLPSPDGPSKGGEENRAVWLEGREGEQGDSPAQLGRIVKNTFGISR